MTAVWKLIITILLLSVIVTDANRARRRRQTVLNAGQRANVNPQTDARQQPLSSNFQGQQQQLPQQGQQLPQQGQLQQQQQQQQLGQAGFGAPKDVNLGQNQAGRQYYYGSPNQYGSQGGNYYPYGGSQYGAGQYPQYGQGIGSYGQGMGSYGQGMGSYGQGMGSSGSYYNQYPGSNSFYQNQNRPPYGSNYGSNYYPGSGTYGGFWNAGQKQTMNIFTVFLSSFLALVICLITV